MNTIVNIVARRYHRSIAYEKIYVILKRIVLPMALAAILFGIAYITNLYETHGKLVMLCILPFIIYASFITRNIMKYPPGKGVCYDERFASYGQALLQICNQCEKILEGKTYKYYRVYMYKHPKGDWVSEVEVFIHEQEDDYV